MTISRLLLLAVGVAGASQYLTAASTDITLQGDSSKWTYWDWEGDQLQGVDVPHSANFYLADSSNPDLDAFPNLTADFSTDKTLHINVFAPEGLSFHITPPDGHPTFLYMGYSLGSDASGTGYDNTDFTATFNNLTGSTPQMYLDATSSGYNSSLSWYINTSGSEVLLVYAVYEITSEVTFSSIDFNVTIPAAYSSAYNNYHITNSAIGVAVANWTGTDPSSIVAFEAVPEPADFAGLTGMSILGIAALARRKRQNTSRMA